MAAAIVLLLHYILFLSFLYPVQSLQSLFPSGVIMAMTMTPNNNNNKPYNNDDGEQPPPPPKKLITTVLFENDRVKVSDVRLERRGDSVVFSSQYPTVRWQVGDGVCTEKRRRRRRRKSISDCGGGHDGGHDHTTQEDEKKERTTIMTIPDKTVFFENGDDDDDDECSTSNYYHNVVPQQVRQTGSEKNEGSMTEQQQQRRRRRRVEEVEEEDVVTVTATPTEIEIVNYGKDDDDDDKDSELLFRQIWFEIKQQQPRRTPEETRVLLENAIYSTNVGTTLLLENKYCRVWDFYYGPGGGDPSVIHHHVLDYVFVYVAKGRLLGYSHTGQPGLFESINDDGDVSWFDIPDGAGQDPNYAHGGKNGYDDLPMREYLVELK